MINLNYIFVILFSLFSYSQVFSQTNKIRISRSVIGSYGGSHSNVTIGTNTNCVIMDNVGEVAVITKSNGNITLTQGFEQATYSLEKLEIELPKIPNAFSPDANGVNDTWPWNQNLDVFYPNIIARVLIFNRWGDLVIEPIENPINLDNIWDGSNKKGEAVASGTYFYIIEYNSGLSQSGWVQLVR